MIAPGSGTIIDLIGRGMRSDFDSGSGSGSGFNSDFCLRFNHLMNRDSRGSGPSPPWRRPYSVFKERCYELRVLRALRCCDPAESCLMVRPFPRNAASPFVRCSFTVSVLAPVDFLLALDKPFPVATSLPADGTLTTSVAMWPVTLWLTTVIAGLQPTTEIWVSWFRAPSAVRL